MEEVQGVITLLGVAGGDHRLERVLFPGCQSNVF
jgi:hypothetical protein